MFKSTEMKVREYKSEDYQSIANLWEETGLSNPQRGDNKEMIEKTLKVGGKLFVLENERQQIIGTSWITNDGRRLYLHHFGIKPEFQGQGLSKVLLDESLKFAVDTGLQIKLEVHKNNEVALNLYLRYGFKYLGDYGVYIIRSY